MTGRVTLPPEVSHRRFGGLRSGVRPEWGAVAAGKGRRRPTDEQILSILTEHQGGVMWTRQARRYLATGATPDAVAAARTSSIAG